jgi:hypothetical protein
MASHLLAAAIRIHHLNPVTAPPLRFVESPWGEVKKFHHFKALVLAFG